MALPESARHTDPGFEHYAPETVAGDGWRARVFLGSLLGDRSPVTTYSPLLGAELLLEPHTQLMLDVDPAFEHGVLVDDGVLGRGRPGDQAERAHLRPARVAASSQLAAYDEPVRLLLLGGEPFGESIVMWWNFVGRTHDEVVAFREEWQAQITAGGAVVTDSQDVSGRPVRRGGR